MRFGRRVRFALLVLAAQVLLIGMTLAWCVHIALILKYGSVHFVEPNPLILYAELITTVLVIVFAATVFALQWKRLGERRRR